MRPGLYAFTDLLLVVYPIFMTWNLRVPIKLKLVICGLMGMGAVGVGVNIANIVTSVIFTAMGSKSFF